MQIARTLAAKLSWLMDNRTDPSGTTWTSRSLAAETTDRGESMSHAAISNIANGTSPNPRIQTVEALANALGVPATIFLREYSEEDLPVLSLLDLPRVRRLVALMEGLSGDDFDMVEDTVRLLRVRRGLDGDYLAEKAQREAPKRSRPGRRRTLTEAAKRAAESLEP
ncbi:helix-turn-helix domain-containing protein [Streptomyces sp. NPDC091027]|uniref:helix-turn-helix domain-containing protein n=1 Tax=Streptomyces sp. NPDC091027 TaxID=3365971 RepID=UPI003813AA7B